MLSFFSIAQSQKALNSIIAVFADSAEIQVSDWTFLYEYINDSKQGGLLPIHTRESKDLLVEVGSETERGITIKDEQKITWEKLRLIRFNWDQLKRIVQNVTIKLKDGHVITIEGPLRAAAGLLGTEETNTWSGSYPKIYVKGSAKLHGKMGNFNMEISIGGDWLDKISDKNKILEIRFPKVEII